MAIEYRNVDAGEIQTQVLTGRALDAERQAFAAEMEVQRLQTVVGLAKSQQDKDMVVLAQREAETNAATLRAKANRVKGDLTLPDDEVRAVRADFLNTWVTSLEQEHVAHAALVEQRRASLAMTGEGAPSDAEKQDIQTRLDASLEALGVIESSWNIATQTLDAIKPGTDEPVAPARPEPAAPSREIAPSTNNAAPVD